MIVCGEGGSKYAATAGGRAVDNISWGGLAVAWLSKVCSGPHVDTIEDHVHHDEHVMAHLRGGDDRLPPHPFKRAD